MSEMHKNATPVQSLERALQIMNYLGTQTNGCGLRELSRQTGLNKSTVYRMLQTLCAYGYVYQDRNTEDYHLGLKILELSAQIMDGFDIRSIARPVLEDLCAVTGESVHLSVLNGLDAIYIENADANPVEINGAENAGLVQDEDGNFVTEDKAETPDPTPETPGDPEQKPSGNDGGQKPDDMNGQASGGKEETASPKTGDSSALLLALGALAGSGAAAGAVLRKKRGM